MLKERREEKVRPSGPSEARKPKSKKLQHIERPRARYVCTVCGCTYCSNNCIVTRDLRIHTLSPNQFLTPKITHPSPAALCAILPTLRENKGSSSRSLRHHTSSSRFSLAWTMQPSSMSFLFRSPSGGGGSVAKAGPTPLAPGLLVSLCCTSGETAQEHV